MLQFLIIALYAGIVTLLQQPFSKKIQNAVSIEEAIRTRKVYKIIRVLSIIIFFILNWACCFLMNYFDDRIAGVDIIAITQTAVIVTIMGHFLQQGIQSFSVFNPISIMTIDDMYKNKKRFSLYLRGFEKDAYCSLTEAQSSNDSSQGFSEFNFTKQMSKITPIYAVGMTKELTSPIGAKRIYLADDTWQKDVRYLMEKASTIFILMNERESCLWEIEQSAEMLHKTCYIVDDCIQYEHIRQKNSVINFPTFSNNEKTPFYFRFINKPYNVVIEGTPTSDMISVVTNHFDNSEEGYEYLTEELFGTKNKNSFFGVVKKVFSFIITFIVLLMINTFIVQVIIQKLNLESPLLLRVTCITLCFLLEWFIYKLLSIKKKRKKMELHRN